MPATLRHVHTLDELRKFVSETLCSHDQLMPDAFALTERKLLRSGKFCGLMFCLHGPRAVKFSAIWDTERNTVLFYNSSGERFKKTQLVPKFGQGAVAA